jgi:hypothetical protein
MKYGMLVLEFTITLTTTKKISFSQAKDLDILKGDEFCLYV